MQRRGRTAQTNNEPPHLLWSHERGEQMATPRARCVPGVVQDNAAHTGRVQMMEHQHDDSASASHHQRPCGCRQRAAYIRAPEVCAHACGSLHTYMPHPPSRPAHLPPPSMTTGPRRRAPARPHAAVPPADETTLCMHPLSQPSRPAVVAAHAPPSAHAATRHDFFLCFLVYS